MKILSSVVSITKQGQPASETLSHPMIFENTLKTLLKRKKNHTFFHNIFTLSIANPCGATNQLATKDDVTDLVLAQRPQVTRFVIFRRDIREEVRRSSRWGVLTGRERESRRAGGGGRVLTRARGGGEDQRNKKEIKQERKEKKE